MEVSVYDTYVPRENNTLMHFDILVESSTSEKDVLLYGTDYLRRKNIGAAELTTKQCRYCHMEIAPPEVEEAINDFGFFIIEMENCQ